MIPAVRYMLFTLLLLGASIAPSQEKTISISAYGSLLVPTGPLSKRFVTAPGGSVSFFAKRGMPQWGGAVEYMKFTRLVDNLSVNRPVTDTVQGIPQKTFYQLPLQKIVMSLEVFGVSVQARYEVVHFGGVLAAIGFGAGIYRWTFDRNEYRDSLNVLTPRGIRTAAVLNVPALAQQDWSGGFDAGVDVGFTIIDPVSLSAGARYKFIIGELWPTLALDLDNVSTFQMLSLRAGISIDF